MGSCFRVWGSWFRGHGLGFRVEGSGQVEWRRIRRINGK